MHLAIRLIAQPKASFRERYPTEMRPDLSCRFLRADPNPDNLDYPTLEIKTSDQCNDRRLFIRVTSVTVRSEKTPMVCVHPYPINARESNVIRDSERNALYFMILDEELAAGRKSFRIIRNKLPQYELRNYGPLRILNTDEMDVIRVDNQNDARELINTYQLGTSQLVFSIAELLYENQLPVTYDTTTVYSNKMTDSSTSSTSSNEDSLVRYAPWEGDQNGGYEMLMVLPKIDRRKPYRVHFEYQQPITIQATAVDTKTIAFTIPPCSVPILPNQRIQIPIVVTRSNEEMARVNFCYYSTGRCESCDQASVFDSPTQLNNNEQDPSADMLWDENI